MPYNRCIREVKELVLKIDKMKKELSIREIKLKQKELEIRIKNLLNEFYQETEVKVRGDNPFA